MLTVLSLSVSHCWARHLGKGHVWVFGEFSFSEASFHPSWSCSGFWLACVCLALPSVLVSVRSSSEFISYSKLFSWNLKGREEGMGLTCFSFFCRLQRMQLSWPQVCLSFWQVIKTVLFWSAAIRMHCETTGVWLKVVSPTVWSSDCWRKNPWVEWLKRLSVELFCSF